MQTPKKIIVLGALILLTPLLLTSLASLLLLLNSVNPMQLTFERACAHQLVFIYDGQPRARSLCDRE
jgi:UPF0716 family protein affecting phage T7 exclusion